MWHEVTWAIIKKILFWLAVVVGALGGFFALARFALRGYFRE